MTKINLGPRAFSPATSNILDDYAAKKGGRHVVDCAWFARGGGWTTEPVSIYYVAERPVDCAFTNRYFGLSVTGNWDGGPVIFDADRVEEIKFYGIHDQMSDEVIFSRWRHDYRCFSYGGPCFVDGGLDYFRTVGHLDSGLRFAHFSVRDGEFVEIL